MSSSIIIGTDNVWSVPSRFFEYYLDKIRACYPPDLDSEDAEIFLPGEQASDFISVEHLPKEKYQYFVKIVEKEFEKYLQDPRKDTDAFRGKAIGWRELIDQLRKDPRYSP